MNRAAEPYLKVSQVVNAFAASRTLHVAIELDVFTSLANEGKTAAQLSTLHSVHSGALELLLNALTALGLLRKEAERFFDTPISQTYLSSSGPKYMGHLIRHEARGWDDWGKLLQALRTGKPVRKPEELEESPAALEDFIRGMHELALARGDARWLARAISLKRCRRLLDLGGGPGTYAAMFCRANRGLEAVVVDLPATLKITRKILREFDMTGRVTMQAADYRTDKIKGGPYDVALLSNILHAESEATNRQLLGNVHEVLAPGALLVVKDHVMSADHTEPQNGALFALEMLLTTRGRTYSFAEISAWLEAAGFRDMTELPLEPPSNVSLVLALRPGKRALVVLPRPVPKVEKTPPEIELELPAPPGARVGGTGGAAVAGRGTPPVRPAARPGRAMAGRSMPQSRTSRPAPGSGKSKPRPSRARPAAGKRATR